MGIACNCHPYSCGFGMAGGIVRRLLCGNGEHGAIGNRGGDVEHDFLACGVDISVYVAARLAGNPDGERRRGKIYPGNRIADAQLHIAPRDGRGCRALRKGKAGYQRLGGGHGHGNGIGQRAAAASIINSGGGYSNHRADGRRAFDMQIAVLDIRHAGVAGNGQRICGGGKVGTPSRLRSG